MPATRAPAAELFADDTHFLSPDNPVATVDQRELETRALELLDTRPIADAMAVALMRYELLAGADLPDAAREVLPGHVRRAAFRSLAMALNSDPNRPRVLGNLLGPDHAWFGMSVPGSRGPGTGENADCWYSTVPVDASARYELVGRVQEPAIGDCPFHVIGSPGFTQNVASLDWRDVVVDDDGTFVITVDPSPADGRPNHLQTTADAKYVFVRDCRQDWTQKPNAYRVRRLDAPSRPELDLAECADLGARLIVEDVPQMWFLRSVMAGLEPNTVTAPAGSGPVGGMAIQAVARGRLHLADDEAYVLRFDSGGAAYWSLSSYDWWAMGGDLSRLVSINDTQATADADGSHTIVFAASDPGVHNWIDTSGRRDTHFLHRWQQLPQSPGSPLPTAAGRVVSLADLDAEVGDTPRISAEGRGRQLVVRAEQVAARYAT